MRLPKKYLLVIVAAIISFGLGNLYGLYLDPNRERGEVVHKEWATNGLFEAEGAITLGCALWEVPRLRLIEDSYLRVNQDFYLYADHDQYGSTLRLTVVHDLGVIDIEGKRCGISVDFRAFPDEARPWNDN